MDEFGPDIPEVETLERRLAIRDSNPFLDAWRLIADPGVSYGDVLWYADCLRNSTRDSKSGVYMMSRNFVPHYWHREAVLRLALNQQRCVQSGRAVYGHHVVVHALSVEESRRMRG